MTMLPFMTNRREGEPRAASSDSAAAWTHGAGAPLRLPSTCKALARSPRPWDPAPALSRLEAVGRCSGFPRQVVRTVAQHSPHQPSLPLSVTRLSCSAENKPVNVKEPSIICRCIPRP